MSSRKAELTRRQFIEMAAFAGVACTGMLGAWETCRSFATTLTEDANSPDDFKALVCVFLYGGNDSNNMVVPTDESTFRDYQSSRKDLALPLNSLLKIANPGGDGRSFGFHPGLVQLQNLYTEGKAAVIANVGTMAAPITKSEYLRGSGQIPRFLFSHLDQQIEWQTSMPDSNTKIGWGGRLADLKQILNRGSHVSMNISMSGRNIFQAGNKVFQFGVDPAGFKTGSRPVTTSEGFIRTALGEVPNFVEQFPHAAPRGNFSWIGQQLQMVLRIIAARKQLGMKRQIFFVSQEGFDLHTNAPQGHAWLLKWVGDALADFYRGTVNLGVANDVVTFTASDFNRTLASNGSGSDHGWGGHQIVLGGSVHGGKIYGKMPNIVSGGPDDIGAHGIWLPSVSVDQYSATLARWFGCSESELTTILPNIRNFGLLDVGFLG
jgi:uncharacterized protein (DUF1501 family)